MRYLKYYLLLLTALLCYAADLRAQTPPESTNVKIYFTARNNKNPVTTLNKEDLLLEEDGVPQRVTTLEGPEEVAVNMSLLIDVSSSQNQKIPTVKTAALSLLNSALRPGKDTALVATFTNGVNVEQGATADLQRLETAIQSLKFVQQPRDFPGRKVVIGNQNTPGATTAIWDAVWIMCEHILPQTDKRARQVIVVFTDGDDISSQKTPEEAAARAMRSNVALYAVRIRKETVYSANDLREMAERNLQIDSGLTELTKPTGGWVYSVKDEKGLAAAIAQVASEVHGQYRISYTPTKEEHKGHYRKVKIKTAPGKKSVKMDIAHQTGYYVDAP